MAKLCAKCPNCGSTLHINAFGVGAMKFPSGICEKCGKRIYTTIFWQED